MNFKRQLQTSIYCIAQGTILNILQSPIMENNLIKNIFLYVQHTYIWGFPGRSDGKSVCLQCGRPGFDPWVRKIPWRRKWQPTPVLLPGKSHRWRSLVGYSPWGHKESDTTERLHFSSDFFTDARRLWNNVFKVLRKIFKSMREKKAF